MDKKNIRLVKNSDDKNGFILGIKTYIQFTNDDHPMDETTVKEAAKKLHDKLSEINKCTQKDEAHVILNLLLNVANEFNLEYAKILSEVGYFSIEKDNNPCG